MAAKKGRQTPTSSYVLPYKKSLGSKAVKLYERSGNKALTWQKSMIKDLMAINDDGLWTHVKFGYTLPRRNGKSEVAIIRCLYGLINGERIMYTAHRTTTSAAQFRKVCQLLDKSGVEYKSIKAAGREHIEIDDGMIDFRTRSGQGGLGEGFDLLVIDEAQEYTDNQETALKYVVSDSPNPQTIFCGTPPTSVSAGTVFVKYRKDCMAGALEDSYWAEWAVPEMSDVHDVKLWYETNPSMGAHLNERKIRAEIGPDEVDFNIQRLGLWIKYNQKSAISPADWAALKLESMPAITGKLYIGIKYSKGTDHVALSIAVKTSSGHIMVEGIDCRDIRSGNYWLIDFIQSADVEKVVVDGASGQQILAADMKDCGIRKKPVLPTVKEVIAANSSFEQGIFQQTICHMDQTSLTKIVSNCDKRAMGSAGGFGYQSQSKELDICLLDSVILAYWACATDKPKRKQRIGY